MSLDIKPHTVPCATCGQNYPAGFFGGREDERTNQMNRRQMFMYGYGCPECKWAASDSEKAKEIYADNDELVRDHYQALKKNKMEERRPSGVLLNNGPAHSFAAYTYEHKYDASKRVTDKDWDNLVILDACRYDIFKKVTNFNQNVDKRLTRTSHSHSFIDYNFMSEKQNDTVCITTNPYYSAFDSDPFFLREDLLSPPVTEINEFTNHSQAHNKSEDIDDVTGAVSPDALSNKAIDVNKKHPNKKLVLHYMQPHTPLLSLSEEFEGQDEWELARRGQISREKLVEAYIENIHRVESSVKELLEEIDGKTIITADHGENLGDWEYGEKQYGHTTHTDNTRFVPWLEVDGERREIEESNPLSTTDIDDELIKENLKTLGYLP